MNDSRPTAFEDHQGKCEFCGRKLAHPETIIVCGNDAYEAGNRRVFMSGIFTVKRNTGLCPLCQVKHFRKNLELDLEKAKARSAGCSMVDDKYVDTVTLSIIAMVILLIMIIVLVSKNGFAQALHMPKLYIRLALLIASVIVLAISAPKLRKRFKEVEEELSQDVLLSDSALMAKYTADDANAVMKRILCSGTTGSTVRYVLVSDMKKYPDAKALSDGINVSRKVADEVFSFVHSAQNL